MLAIASNSRSLNASIARTVQVMGKRGMTRAIDNTGEGTLESGLSA